MAYQKYCKCACAGSTVVNQIDLCLLCTEDWCLDQKSDLCGETTDVMAINCFQRESAKEYGIVLLFLLLVAALLGYTAIQSFRR